ncbi:MAG: hypothetical protein FJY98_01730 [Candidatus Liptonbacteria bacterium]|nr:hypothetical protein [Candidatus Pacearchaeota archaeon]MBM3257028.1 hypothetical protein [Candidatus Liptonbacteria bacterium]
MRKKANWRLVLIVLALVVLAFFAGLFVQKVSGTGLAIDEKDDEPLHYTWTFALCTLSGKCMDITVECNGTRVMNTVSVTEIKGNDFGWEDPRGGNPRVCPWEN